jgi:hypothetical protein
MTAFISNLYELAALLFNILRLPALLPALTFNVANAVLVLPHLGDTRVGSFYSGLSEGERILCILLCTIFLTYFLEVINYSLIRWFEGYPWLQGGIGQWLQKQHLVHHEELEAIYKARPLRKGDSVTLFEARQSSSADDIASTSEQALAIEEFVMCYPADKSRVLPTRFGNIVSAAEDYPYQMYKMNAVSLWPLLTPVLANSGYAKFVEYEKSALDFVLNSLVLSLVLGGELLLCSVFSGIHWLYIAAEALVVLTVVLLLYELSLSGAMGWGTTIRTSFDLHREQLRKAVNLASPSSFAVEQINWERFSDFVTYRDSMQALGKEELFQYPVPEETGLRTSAKDTGEAKSEK